MARRKKAPSRGPSPSSPLKLVGYGLALIVLAYIGYSVYYYLSSVEQIEEFQVCYEDRCIKTFHIHTTIEFDVCGEPLWLPLEHGPLEESHTHKERNLVHFHERLPFDPTTGELLDTTPLQLGQTLAAYDSSLTPSCLNEYCTGDPCPDGKPGTLRLLVNGVENTLFDRYVWKDGDRILIRFGD